MTHRNTSLRILCILLAQVFVLALAGGAMLACEGPKGATGSEGPEGPGGSDGASALVNVTMEAAGANCTNGGLKIDSGIDDNSDGVLDAGEVDSTTYVCNGADGSGNDGLTALVATTDEPAGDNCANGGQRVDTGIDDNSDGVLDPDEIDNTSYVCNGEDLIPEANESCVVCHGPGKVEDVAEIHPDPEDTPLTVTITSVTDTGGGILQVAFSLTDPDGDGVTGFGQEGNRCYLSDIVPAGTVTSWGTWDTDYLERWAYEYNTSSKYTTLATCSTDADCTAVLGAGATCTGSGNTHCQVDYTVGTWTEVGQGDYTYTFLTALGSAFAMIEAPDYDANHVQRVILRIDGTGHGYTRAVGIQDFMVDGTLVSPDRVLAPTDGCKKCHSPEMNGAAHASDYLDTRACAMCHSPLGHYGEEMQDDGAWLTNMVHQIHAAIPIDAFSNQLDGRGFGAVTYPQRVANCATCHTGDGNMADAWETNPTAEACGSCHVGVDFATGDGHDGGAQPTNQFCAGCHSDTAIEGYHAFEPEPVDVPEFDVSLSMTAPDNGEYYDVGEAPLVTVTLKKAADGSDVDTAFYTSPKGAAGDVSDTALSSASVYIYGPRAESVPVLATGTMTDPTYDPATLPTQGHNLFTGGADPLVMTDASGFKYQLLEIPEDMEPGTYMVRVRIGDYGRVGTGDYHIESVAFTNIQIGTADVEPKVSGDACIDCHGTGNLEPHNERHAVVFDTDQCLACHDQSGNHGVPIANRVHAIHSANSDGDLYTIEGSSRDWEDVTYPQGIDRCVTCHTPGNSTTYHTKPFEMPCAGCHVMAGNGVLDHMRQNGGPF